MIFDNLPLPLPWYDSILKQDRLRKHVNEVPIFAQFAPYDGLLPFQFRKQAASELPTTWKIKCCAPDATIEDYINGYEDDTVCDLSAYIGTALQYGTLDGQDWFMYKNVTNGLGIVTAVLPDGLPAGLYYMEMNFVETARKHVSEVFRVPEFRYRWQFPEDRKYPQLVWRNTFDIPPIHYLGDDSFFNTLTFDSFITASEPEIVQEIDEDGYNEPIPYFQKAVIKYKTSMLVPDYVKVALFTMQIHDVVELYTEYGIRGGQIKNIEVTASPTADETYSVVTITFEQIQLITRTNCEVEMVEPDETTPTGGMALVTTYCNATGSVTADVATFPPEHFAKLQGFIGGVWVTVKTYISRAQIIAGWTGSITPSAGATKFRLEICTFTNDTGVYSAESTPTPSC